MIIKINLDKYIKWKLDDNIEDYVGWLKSELETAWREGIYPLHERIKIAADYFAETSYIPKHIVENWEEAISGFKLLQEDEISADTFTDNYDIQIEWM